MDKSYSVLVNSSDGFEDCWYPFFALFEKYWPSCDAPIFLNTELKDWQYDNFKINCTVVDRLGSGGLTWSECLLRALDQVETPFVLYFQEDYFLHQPVRSEIIVSAIRHMELNREVKHIALSQNGGNGPYEEYPIDGFQKISNKAKYRISTQAALWRKETLRSYLRASENGWMFEIYGTWRARRRTEVFLCANFEPENGGPAIDYIHTGIIKGRWNSKIQNVFESNGIIVDYSARGFYKPRPELIRKLEVITKLLERPAYLIQRIFKP